MSNSRSPDDGAGLPPRAVGKMRRQLLDWFDHNARKLPWRTEVRDPYAVWVSEVMLQQTRVSTVVPYFERFMKKFPDVASLAHADLDDVLSMWSGLGYYRRARLMHAAAREIVERGETGLPGSFDALLKLSGIGQYTAAAIASMAFDEPVAVVDGNVLRVLARVLADGEPIEASSTQKRIRETASAIVGPTRPGALNEALMELGATVCTPTAPSCPTCPIRGLCAAYGQGLVDRLPVTTRRKPSPRVRMEAYVVHHGERVWLCRRRHDGLFGGLWEPPMVPSPAGAYSSSLSARLEVKLTRARGKVEHVLTHRILEVRVMHGRAARATEAVDPPDGYDRSGWFGRDEMVSLGVSALANKVLVKGGVKEAGRAGRATT